jgi:hypothetical protein
MSPQVLRLTSAFHLLRGLRRLAPAAWRGTFNTLLAHVQVFIVCSFSVLRISDFHGMM